MHQTPQQTGEMLKAIVMSEPTCGTCSNWIGIGVYCDDDAEVGGCPNGRSRLSSNIMDCHVRPEPCPPPGFLFTKRDGAQAAAVPIGERKPGTPWAWPVCPECHGKGGGSNFHHSVINWRCPDCHGTGALRPAVEQHQVTR